MSNKLKDVREKAHMTQEELAKKSGVSRGTISAIENNQDKAPSTKTLVALAKALNVSVVKIFFADGV